MTGTPGPKHTNAKPALYRHKAGARDAGPAWIQHDGQDGLWSDIRRDICVILGRFTTVTFFALYIV